MAVVALACAALVCSCGSKGTKITEGNKGEMDSLSYCLGANIGGGIKQQLGDIPFNIEVVKLAGEGAHFNAWLPSKTAYDVEGNKELGIEANVLLNYDVEIVDIKYNR